MTDLIPGIDATLLGDGYRPMEHITSVGATVTVPGYLLTSTPIGVVEVRVGGFPHTWPKRKVEGMRAAALADMAATLRRNGYTLARAQNVLIVTHREAP